LGRRVRNGLDRIWNRLFFTAFDHYLRAGRSLPRLLQDLEKVNYRALERYSPPPTRCRVSLFQAAHRPSRGHDRALASVWSGVAGGGVDVHMVPGEGIDHFSVMREPHVRA